MKESFNREKIEQIIALADFAPRGNLSHEQQRDIKNAREVAVMALVNLKAAYDEAVDSGASIQTSLGDEIPASTAMTNDVARIRDGIEKFNPKLLAVTNE